MTIPKARVEDFTQDSGARIDIRQEETFREPRLMRQLIRLWHKLADGAPSRMFADQVMREVLHTLAWRTDGHIPARHARERLRLTRFAVSATTWRPTSQKTWM